MLSEAQFKEIVDAVPEYCNEMPSFIFEIPGFTGEKVQALFALLAEAMPQVKWLEVGAFYGATISAAAYGHDGQFVTVDDFRQCENAEEARTSVTALAPRCGFRLVDLDCFSPEALTLVPEGVEIYFFDGPHGAYDHARAISHYAPKLADEFLLIVDDWNWETTRDGTHKGILDARLKISWIKEIKANVEPGDGDRYGWWNSLGVFALKKKEGVISNGYDFQARVR
jgi:hypothetical protein